MIRPIQILKDLIEGTAHTVVVDTITDNGGNSYTLEVCNTFYLNPTKKITIDAVEYTVTDFVLNESLTITGASLPTATSFEIDPPLFVYGTPKFVSTELQKIGKADKYPFTWLIETSDTENDSRPEARIKLTPNYTLLFLDAVDKTKWTIADHYSKVIDCQLNEVNYIIRVLKKRRDLFESEDLVYSTRNHANFGDYITNKGYDRQILSDDVSGVQMSLQLPYIVNVCECDEPIVSICEPVTITEDNIFKEYVPAGGTFNYASGGGSSMAEVENSNATYTASFDTADNPLVLPNTTVEVFIDAVSQGTSSIVTLDPAAEINIIWI